LLSHVDLGHLTASNVYVAELNGYKVFRVSLAREREAIPRWTEPIARFLEDLVGHRLVEIDTPGLTRSVRKNYNVLRHCTHGPTCI
jgi:hypothetical protein